MTGLIELGFGLLFLLGSVFFSASETALVSLSPQKAKRLALKNPHIAQALAGWLEHPHELLIIILVGNTLTVVMFATFLTTASVKFFEAFSPSRVELISWAIQTLIITISAEIAPKLYARFHAEKTSLMVLPWLSKLRRIFTPVLSLINKFVDFFATKEKSIPVGQILTFSSNELKNLLKESFSPPTASGTSSESVNIMERVLNIHNQTVKKIMTPISKVDWVELHPGGKTALQINELVDLIIEDGHTRTPIKRRGQFIGFIHTDDLLSLILRSSTDGDFTKFIRPLNFVSEEIQVSLLLNDFKNSSSHLRFVINPEGQIVGIITLEDVLEEITGEILDEYDFSDAKQEKLT